MANGRLGGVGQSHLVASTLILAQNFRGRVRRILRRVGRYPPDSPWFCAVVHVLPVELEIGLRKRETRWLTPDAGARVAPAFGVKARNKQVFKETAKTYPRFDRA